MRGAQVVHKEDPLKEDDMFIDEEKDIKEWEENQGKGLCAPGKLWPACIKKFEQDGWPGAKDEDKHSQDSLYMIGSLKAQYY